MIIMAVCFFDFPAGVLRDFFTSVWAAGKTCCWLMAEHMLRAAAEATKSKEATDPVSHSALSK